MQESGQITCKIARASCARLYIHKATFLARTRSASSCKVTQVYSTWGGRHPGSGTLSFFLSSAWAAMATASLAALQVYDARVEEAQLTPMHPLYISLVRLQPWLTAPLLLSTRWSKGVGAYLFPETRSFILSQLRNHYDAIWSQISRWPHGAVIHEIGSVCNHAPDSLEEAARRQVRDLAPGGILLQPLSYKTFVIPSLL